MPKPFQINSISIPIFSSDYLSEKPGWMRVDELVSYVVGLGATDVRVVNTMGVVETLTSNNLRTDSPLLANEADLSAFIRKFKAAGLRVELAPFVPLDISQLSSGGGKPSPTDPKLFLTNYGNLLSQWAKFAQDNKVDRFSVIQDDINHLLYEKQNAEHFLPIILKIKTIYSGTITTMIFADGNVFGNGGILSKDGSFNNTNRASHFQLMDKKIYDALDILGVGIFTDPITDKLNPTVDEIVGGMLKNPNGLNVVEFLKNVHTFYDKPIYYADRTFHSFDGSNISHVQIFDNNQLVVDQQEQADLYEAFFRIWSQYQEDWMLGVSFNNANRLPDYIPTIARFVDSPYGENFQGKLAETVIREWYSGNRQGQGLDWQGSANADRLIGGYHHDKLKGLGGNDVLDGGQGLDVAIFSGNRASYQVAHANGAITVTDTQANRDGVDSAISIERLQFADGTLAFDTSGAAGQVYRLYQAAFARTPDTAGLKHNVGLVDGGLSLQQMSSAFLASLEFQQKYGSNPTDNAYINALYRNVLGRDADLAGLEGWQARLNDGSWTRTTLLIGFSESPENIAKVSGAIANGMWLA